MIFKVGGCFQFPEAVVTSAANKAYALLNAVHYKFSLLFIEVETAVYNCNKVR